MEAIRKAGPTPQDVHIDQILTNLSIAYIQDHGSFIADRIFPVLPVQKQSDRYFIYNKGDWFRDEAQRRAPATESVGSGYTLSDDSYFCDVWAIHKDIDAQTRANTDQPLNADRDATEFVTQRLMISRERQFVQNYLQAGIWETDWSGTTSAPSSTEFIHFDDYTNSDPIRVFGDVIEDIEGRTGFTPNVCAMDSETWRVLKDHPDLVERYKYTQSGIMTPQLVAPLLGVDNILVAKGLYNTAKPGATDAFERIHDNFVFLAYVQPTPALLRPSAGYTFAWSGYGGANAYGLTISRFYLDLIKADRIEGELAYDQKVVATDLGAFLDDPIS